MKTKIIPFDLETAKKIQAGEIKGKIKTRDSKDVDEIVFFNIPLEYNIYAVIDGSLHSFTEKGFEKNWDKSGKWCCDLILEVPDNESQFKPFDKVLGKSNSGEWVPDIYSHMTSVGRFICLGGIYEYIIPYKGNEHLVGITNKPKEE